jgi:hypothetical protein
MSVCLYEIIIYKPEKCKDILYSFFVKQSGRGDLPMSCFTWVNRYNKGRKWGAFGVSTIILFRAEAIFDG